MVRRKRSKEMGFGEFLGTGASILGRTIAGKKRRKKDEDFLEAF